MPRVVISELPLFTIKISMTKRIKHSQIQWLNDVSVGSGYSINDIDCWQVLNIDMWGDIRSPGTYPVVLLPDIATLKSAKDFWITLRANPWSRARIELCPIILSVNWGWSSIISYNAYNEVVSSEYIMEYIGETIKVACDGANYRIVSRTIPKPIAPELNVQLQKNPTAQYPTFYDFIGNWQIAQYGDPTKHFRIKPIFSDEEFMKWNPRIALFRWNPRPHDWSDAQWYINGQWWEKHQVHNDWSQYSKENMYTGTDWTHNRETERQITDTKFQSIKFPASVFYRRASTWILWDFTFPMVVYDETFNVAPQDMFSYDVYPTGTWDVTREDWKTVPIFFRSMINNPKVGIREPHYIFGPKSEYYCIVPDYRVWLSPYTYDALLFAVWLKIVKRSSK